MNEKHLITLKELQDSKLYIRNGVTFQQPSGLVNQFFEAVRYEDSDALTIEYQNPVLNINEDDNTENVAYPRFKVEVNKGSVEFGDYANVFGMMIAMDQQSPIVKVYSGMNVQACLNLSVFGKAYISEQNLLSSLDSAIETAKTFYQNNEMKINHYADVHERLIKKVFDEEALNRQLGKMLRRTMGTKLGTSPIVGAAKLIETRTSEYSINEDGSITAYKLYNAITQIITDSKDLLYKPEKSYTAANLVLN